MLWRLCLALFLCLNISMPSHADDLLRIGVLSKRGDSIVLERWTSTADYLTEQLPGYRFTIVPLDFDALDDAVENQEVDFVITNTLYFAELEHSLGVTRIATLKNLGLKNEVLTNFGGVIFVRKESAIESLSQLRGKKFGAVEQNSFGGWVMARKELRNNGLEQEDFSQLEFLKTHDQVVYAVLDGRIDAGTVRTDTLERMAQENLLSLEQIRVLEPKHHPDFPYLVSTDLYPEWPFASLPSVSADIAQQVLLALLNMPSTSKAALDARIAGWSSPLDYSKVDMLLQEFGLGPYSGMVEEIVVKERDITFTDIWNTEEILLALVLLISFGALMYRYYRRTRLLDIKLSTFNILLIAFELTVILFLIVEILILDRLENTLSEASQQRFNMVTTADELRQSSDDLTHYARAYAVTSNREFKRRYEHILDIRNGIAPRPVNYQDIYWDLNAESRKKRHPDGETRSLKALIHALPFSESEQRRLLQSEQYSNNLVNLEKRAFSAVEKGNNEQATSLLFSDEYYAAKHEIMLPIDQMMSILEVRTQAEIDTISRQVHRQFNYLLGLSLIFILGNLLAYWLLRKKINQPVAYLTDVIRHFRLNHKGIEEKHFYRDEVGLMIEQYFTMQQTIQAANQQLEEMFSRTRESIEYAALIQNVLIPTTDTFERYFDETFTLWQPKDVVGGDIFLLEEMSNEDEVLLMVIDCTGHGVAGAFVTMLVKAIERHTVSMMQKNHEKVSPARMLSVFNRSIKNLLKQHGPEAASNVGFDGGILFYDRRNSLIRFAGANCSLYQSDDTTVEIIKGNRHSIGYKSSDIEYEFTDHEIPINRPMNFYLPTDGYIDQNGGEKGFPFGKTNFVKLIKQYSNKPMEQQYSLFAQALRDYQGDEVINDDITLVAFSVHPTTDDTGKELSD
ncbi:hypothetical protein CSW98_13590 [Vibrio sp. HA2012]|uniref:PhnD/SsuA/transferrin family substrate-binding protein n=1 Tax=Vibrio sp. HA2012 TaxID=1971595 RepID=UPI000C2B9C87|nr:PhnD/SsuA/transferrin family substrate-binding protein [Vibrio sp. HA2012]PJC85609.1 hypothetical protein CSW98_13590 [Vibrio sp. HA2012]